MGNELSTFDRPWRRALAPSSSPRLDEEEAMAEAEDERTDADEQGGRGSMDAREDAGHESDGELRDRRRSSEEDGLFREIFGNRQARAAPFIDLFGDLPRREHRRIARPPRIHETLSVQCDVNLNKDTLRLLPVAQKDEEGEERTDKALYQLQFRFDSNTECRIRVFFVAKEKRDENNALMGYVSVSDGAIEVPALQFPAGMKQEYTQPPGHLFDTSLFTEEELDHNAKTQTYPVIIVIEPVNRSQVSSQATFATLLKCADDTYAIKAVKVKIEYAGVTYVVHDIYGLDPASETGKECVICMTEIRDTIVLPCRHMCLCRACAELLRYQTNKCPICRSLFTSLLKVAITHPNNTNKESDDEGKLKSKRKSKKQTKKEKKVAERETLYSNAPASPMLVEEHEV